MTGEKCLAQEEKQICLIFLMPERKNRLLLVISGMGGDV